MKVVVTGGGGLIGTRLAKRLLQGADEIGLDVSELVLIDQRFPPGFMQGHDGVRLVEGDLTSTTVIDDVIGNDCDWLIHLAATLTISAEEDFNQGMNINFHAVQRMLDICRRKSQNVKFFMPGSIAVFSGHLPYFVDDDQKVRPKSSYGAEKALCELLLGEYSRRGFVDCRCMRLPFVLLRPGKPSGTVSDLVASITREPLYGRTFEIPWRPESRLSVASVDSVVNAIIAFQSLPASALADSRVINMPSLCVTVQDMVDSLKRVGKRDLDRFLTWKPQQELQAMIDEWPKHLVSSFASVNGFRADESFDNILARFIQEHEIIL